MSRVTLVYDMLLYYLFYKVAENFPEPKTIDCQCTSYPIHVFDGTPNNNTTNFKSTFGTLLTMMHTSEQIDRANRVQQHVPRKRDTYLTMVAHAFTIR